MTRGRDLSENTFPSFACGYCGNQKICQSVIQFPILEPDTSLQTDTVTRTEWETEWIPDQIRRGEKKNVASALLRIEQRLSRKCECLSLFPMLYSVEGVQSLLGYLMFSLRTVSFELGTSLCVPRRYGNKWMVKVYDRDLRDNPGQVIM
jgi:hypothetical protein